MRYFKIMQSQRKNSGSYFLRHESAVLRVTKSDTKNKKKSVETQTENIGNFQKGDLHLHDFFSMSIDEIKDNYASTLSFLNCCHEFINKIFGDSTFGDSKLEKMIGFRVPEVPNYFHVLEMFLEKSGSHILDQNWSKIEILKGARRNNDKNDSRGAAKETGDDQIIFDLQQFLPKTIGDGPSSNTSGIRSGAGGNNVKQSMFNNSESMRVDNDLMKNMIASKKRPSTASPSRLVKSEKDIPKRPSRHELKALSTTFEEILKTCNEFDKKSNEHLFVNDGTPDNCQNFDMEGTNTVLPKYEQGSQQTKQEMIMDDDHFQIFRQNKTFSSGENILMGSSHTNTDNFNLIDYALKNLKDSEYDSDSPPLSPQIRPTKKRSEIVSISPSRALLTENLPDALLNFQNVSLTNKKSWTVLNKTCQSQSPQKVNEMFKKISTENLNSPGKAKSSCEFSDSETFIKFIDNDDLSEDYEKEYCNRGMLKYCNRPIEEDIDVKVASSTDSIILTDEEFERRNRNGCVTWSPEKVSVNKEKRSKRSRNTKSDGFVQKIAYKPMVKSHPLKLTDKDKTLADQKVLKKIGLFTDKGDFRPGVISILEEKQRMSFTRNSPKNFQFRTERKFDMNILNSKYINQLEKPVSKESLNEKSSMDGSNTSLHSSAVTFSSSTVSDSDLFGMEPTDTQTVIKKL